MKNYIKPTIRIVLVEMNQLVAQSSLGREYNSDDVSYGNEDFGWGDDDDPASWNWKNN